MRLSRDLADLLASSALSALLFATGTLLPLIGPPAGFLSTAPLIWIAARHGLVAGYLGGALATAALLPALPPPVVLIFAIEHALPAGYLGWRLARGRGIFAGSALAALLVTVVMAAATILFLGGSGRDPAQAIEEQLRASLQELGALGGDGAQQAGPLAPGIEEVIALLRRVLPAMTLIGIFLECSLNSLVAVRVLARAPAAVPPPALAAFALPDWLIWVLIPCLALALTPQPTVSTIAFNILLPLLFAYLVQGLSILLHLSARARLSPLGRALGAIALALFPWLLAAPLLLGLLDFRFGFRSRWPTLPPPT